MRRPAKQARGPEQNTLLASSGRCEGRGQLRKGHTWGPTPQEENLARWTTWKGRGAPAGRQTRRRGWGSELTPRSVRASPPRISTRPRYRQENVPEQEIPYAREFLNRGFTHRRNTWAVGAVKCYGSIWTAHRNLCTGASLFSRRRQPGNRFRDQRYSTGSPLVYCHRLMAPRQAPSSTAQKTRIVGD